MKFKEEKQLGRKRIIIYLAVTYVLTYTVEIFLIRPMAGGADLNQAYLAQALTAGVMFLPAVGALIARIATGDKLIGSNLMLSLNLKGNLKYYALSWFGVAGLILFGTVLYFLIFPGQFDPALSYVKAMLEAVPAEAGGAQITTGALWQMMIIQILAGIFLSPFVNLITCFGEEWGWRGYLLPQMLKQLPVVPALLINGVIWGLWHAPLTVMGHNYGLGYKGYPVTGILAMCVFCTVTGILLSYVTIKTNSCIPAIMGHGVLNGFASIGIYFTSLEKPYNIFLGPTPVGVIGGAGFILVSAVLLRRLYREEKSREG